MTLTAPSASAARAAATSSGQSAGWQPLRPRPVSALSWTRAVRPPARAAATISSSAHRPLTETSMSASMASRQGPPGVHSQHISLPWSPAARSARASCGVAVPSQLAPASRAARAHGTAPCPYPSDFTTAISSARGARARSVRTLARRASRSISARARQAAVPGDAGATGATGEEADWDGSFTVSVSQAPVSAPDSGGTARKPHAVAGRLPAGTAWRRPVRQSVRQQIPPGHAQRFRHIRSTHRPRREPARQAVQIRPGRRRVSRVEPAGQQ